MKHLSFASTCLLVSLAATGCGLEEQLPERAIFVANGSASTISVIDPKDGRVTDEITLDEGFHPHHLSLSPDGEKLAVAAPTTDFSGGHDHGTGGGTSKVYLLDSGSGSQSGVLDVDATVHNAVFLDDFSTLVLAMMEHGMIAGYGVDKLDEQWTTGVGADPLEVTSVGGDRLVVANSGDGTLSIVDSASHKSLDLAEVGDTPVAMWATPGGLFVSLEGAKQVAIVNPGNLTEVTGTYDVGGVPGQVAATESGGEIWIAVEDRGVIEVRDAKTGDVAHTIEVGGKPHGVHIDREGGLVYVTDEGASRVVLVDLASHEVKGEIAVGKGPNGILQNSF